MLFNSFTFFVFFILTWSLYSIFYKNYKIQNKILLIASYIFYGWWDFRFLFLIFLSTVIDFYLGKKIYNTALIKEKTLYRNLSIFSNLLILGFFKYFNFFLTESVGLLNMFGFEPNFITLNIVLPVGISFYTFQTMSYTWDVYKNDLKPITNFFDFALFVSFFPQLVAGPIERAKNLIPQIIKPRKITYNQIYEGCYLISWGLFKKIAIADKLAIHVNMVFNNWQFQTMSWVDVIMATWMFAWQIYCDFSGYSDIARGLSKLLGFELMINFNIPFAATSPSDFWRRWHISLSTWLRDYLYIPLGGSKKGKILTYRNLFLTMFLGGLWHGANLTFVIWGIYQGVLLIIHKIYSDVMKKYSFYLKLQENIIYKILAWVFTSIFIAYGWLIFRVQDFKQLYEMTITIYNKIGVIGSEILYPSMLINTAVLLFVIQIFQFYKKDLMFLYKTRFYPLRSCFYIIIFYSLYNEILVKGGIGAVQEFIYFQF